MLKMDMSRVACTSVQLLSQQFAANYPNVPNFVSHYTRERREERREESDGAAEYFSERAGAGARARALHLTGRQRQQPGQQAQIRRGTDEPSGRARHRLRFPEVPKRPKYIKVSLDT